MNGNFVKIDRRILEWEWYKNTPTKVLFLHLLLKANWKPGRFEGHEIPRGSIATSINNLAQETGLTVNQVRKALDRLKMSGEITSKSTNKFTVINIVKYSVYQDVRIGEEQAKEQTENKRGTNEEQTENKRGTTIEEKKEYKEIKEEKKERKSASPLPLDSVWDEIVSLYPKRGSKDNECKELYIKMLEAAEDKTAFIKDTKGTIADYLESYAEDNPDDQDYKFALGLRRFIKEKLLDGIKEQENKRNRFTGWEHDGNTISYADLMNINTNQGYDHGANPAFMEVLSEIYRRYPIHEFTKDAYEKAFLFLVNQYPDSEGVNRLCATCGRYFREKNENKDRFIPDFGYWLYNVAEKYMKEIKDFKEIV